MSEKGRIIKICKDYTDQQLEKIEKHLLSLMDARIDALKEATTLARESMEVRLTGMNEFRDSLKDQSQRFQTRGEQEIFSKKIYDDLNDLKEWKNKSIGKADQSTVNLALAISLLGLTLGFLSLLLNLFK